eukprot:448394-Hanusia_phi.AAC.2
MLATQLNEIVNSKKVKGTPMAQMIGKPVSIDSAGDPAGQQNKALQNTMPNTSPSFSAAPRSDAIGSKCQSVVNPAADSSYDRQRQLMQSNVKSERTQAEPVNGMGLNSYQNQNDMPNRMERLGNESSNPYTMKTGASFGNNSAGFQNNNQAVYNSNPTPDQERNSFKSQPMGYSGPHSAQGPMRGYGMSSPMNQYANDGMKQAGASEHAFRNNMNRGVIERDNAGAPCFPVDSIHPFLNNWSLQGRIVVKSGD